MKSLAKNTYNAMLSLLFQWFEGNKRSLPWRIHYRPYEVWISEMMLQQTQMERGVEYFLRWMEKFPTVFDVARASEREILQAWEGLGYYSRAKNLHKASKIICEVYNGEIPCDYDALLALPGIGPYTVAAIMGIAFEKDFATIDANVERVFSRICNITDKNLKSLVTEEVNKILPSGKARIFNQALMEFGALLCKKVPQCAKCPICKFCDSYVNNVQNERPIPKKKAEIIPVYATFCILKHKDKGFFMRQRPHKGLWADMWEFIGLDTFMIDSMKHESKQFSYKTKEAEKVDSLAEGMTSSNMNSSNIQNSNLFSLSPVSPSSPLLVQENAMETFARSLLMDELKNLFSQALDENVFKNLSTTFLKHFLDSKSSVIKHSYTNHRLQAYFFYKEITFDISCLEGYKWFESLNDIPMPAHHRKALGKVLKPIL